MKQKGRDYLGWWASLCLCLLVLAGCQREGVDTSPSPTITNTPSPTPLIGVFLHTRAVPTTAVLQTTPTPSPTPTVTPTPTPIIYTIGSGDTLLGIAIEQNTTVAEIEALNEGIKPELLQIGQQIVMPPPDLSTFIGVVATTEPINMELVQVQTYRTPVGGVWLFGELLNIGQSAVENVQVSVGLLNEAGEVLDTAVIWTESAIILPNEKTPFGLLFSSITAEVVQPAVAIVGGQTVVELGSRYVDVTVMETAVLDSESTWQLSGQLINNGTLTATQISLITTLYDAQDKMIGFQQTPVEGYLFAGETVAFEFVISPASGGQIQNQNTIVQSSHLDE